MSGITFIEQGNTAPSDWKDNSRGGGGIYVDIDLSGYEFSETPHYLTSIEGEKHHWDVGGVNSIYNATEKGFRVYIKWIYKIDKPLTRNTAIENGWFIRWTAILKTTNRS